MSSPSRFALRFFLVLFGTTLARAESVYSTPHTFTTFAGASSLGSADGTGAAARFQGPAGVAVDAAGNLFVADVNNHTIRKVTPAGVVTTFAGKAGVAGSADGTGDAARLNRPLGLAIDLAGNLYVGDTNNNSIRKITPAGAVTTLAGLANNNGSADGVGSAARFNFIGDVAVDAAGNVYVVDLGNCTIRKIDPAGVVTTLAGSAGMSGVADGLGAAARFRQPFGLAVDPAGNVFLFDSVFVSSTSNSWTYFLKKITPDGNVSTVRTYDVPGSQFASTFPQGQAFDAAGNRFEVIGHIIRRVATDGTSTTLAGREGGEDYADGTGAAAVFMVPSHLAVDAAGNVLLADTGGNTVRKVTPGGVVTTLAGLPFSLADGNADGTGTAARFGIVQGVALAPSGDLYAVDTDNYLIRKITPGGTVSTFANLAGLTVQGTPPATAFVSPVSIAIDVAGNVYVGETAGPVRKITPAGVLSTLGQVPSSATGIAVDGAGNIYVSDLYSSTIYRFPPGGVGTVFVGQLFSEGRNDGTGPGARFNAPRGLAVDAAGNLYVADSGNFSIRKVTPGGVVTTLAGSGTFGSEDGTGAAARFNGPDSLAFDGNGNLLVTDTWNQTIRRITPAGVVTTIAGRVDAISNLDGTGIDAHFYYPHGIAVNANRDVYVASGTEIRKGFAAGRPAITAQPQNVTAASGANVQFSVTASADPAPSYQWYLNGGLLNGATAATLTVNNVQMANAGSYTVIVANPLGTATSAAAVLTVTTTPTTPPTTPAPGGSGGGGAPSAWFLGLLGALGLTRRMRTMLNRRK